MYSVIFFINDRSSFPGDAFRFHGNDGLFAVVEEPYGSFPFSSNLTSGIQSSVRR